MKALRIVESGHRDAVVLENGLVRVVIDLEGGMVPEFSLRREKAYINAHWIPQFRATSPLGKAGGALFDEKFWTVPLLSRIAGNFPCFPAFGSGEPVDGVEIPAHGWTANGTWELVGLGVTEAGDKAWARFRMLSSFDRLDLEFDKIDMLLVGECIHYSFLGVRNLGPEEVAINAAWHNTVGPPLLEPGCRISASAERWISAPEGGEFDDTGRLVLGKEFGSLAGAPLRDGGLADLSLVPGMIGFTDFATGAIPTAARLGWSACVNPRSAMAYVTWFPGPAAVHDGEIGLNFNDLWMQYGGRPFTPWALYKGGSDQTYCLGMENSTAAWANGLAESRRRKELLGRPTTVPIKKGERKVLPYATGLFDLRSMRAGGPVIGIESDDKGLTLSFAEAAITVKAEGLSRNVRMGLAGDTVNRGEA
jgi:hypothetical protein